MADRFVFLSYLHYFVCCHHGLRANEISNSPSALPSLLPYGIRASCQSFVATHTEPGKVLPLQFQNGVTLWIHSHSVLRFQRALPRLWETMDEGTLILTKTSALSELTDNEWYVQRPSEKSPQPFCRPMSILHGYALPATDRNSTSFSPSPIAITSPLHCDRNVEKPTDGLESRTFIDTGMKNEKRYFFNICPCFLHNATLFFSDSPGTCNVQ